MSLQESLKLIHDVAKKYLIDKPYIVGGLPRDIYMNIPNVKTTDIDITTNSPEILRLGILLAEELNVTFELFDDGHVTVFSEDFDLDFSSHFISEKVLEYLDGEHKGFEEAFSRDFTINALHQDLITGKIVDPTGHGFRDIKNKVIKTPVPAEITLADDPRRIYRAINLAVRYDFKISPDIKKFALNNSELFGPGNIKDKYISVKINKALKENEDLTLTFLKELGLFKKVPLSGLFKDVLIDKKLLVDYLGSSALDNKVAFMAGTWKQYMSQGPEYKEVGDWWKSNAKDIAGQWNSSYKSWVTWYNDKYRGEWNYKHKGPKEVLDIMKSEVDSGWGITPLSLEGLTESFKRRKWRKHTLYDFLGPDEEPQVEPDEEPQVEPEEDGALVGDRKNVYIKPGVNVDNVTFAVKNFIDIVGSKAKELGAQTPIITSGWRSVENQSALMGRNWQSNGGINGGRRYLEGLYGKQYGGQMASIFEQYGVGQQAQVLGAQVIKDRPVGSYHIVNPGQALDFSVTSGIKKVLDSVKSEGLFDMKIVDETETAGPHYHVLIRGENFRLANIRDRKEQLKKLSNY